MHRLYDHFRPAWPEPARAAPLASERPSGRPELRRGRYGGLPLWYHASGPANGVHLQTDAGEPFDPDDAIACLQFEHYLYPGGFGSGTDSDRLKQLYYLCKPFLPRSVQLELQRLNARRRLERVRFPAWPHDATLGDLFSVFFAARMRAAEVDSVSFLGFWPHGKSWAWCLTHDVDTHVGYTHVEPMARAEEDRGVHSCWYFVPERYRLDRRRLEELRQRGHEIGVHGLQHSTKLFSSRSEFEWRVRKINAYMKDWGVVGFRSPATYRNPYWLPEIDADYDSSYMDNATLEPQPGGVCAPFPFHLNDRMVELPITLPMDHTLLNILRQDVVEACRRKAAWVRAQHGLVLPLFHPDYNTTPERVGAYGAVLDELAADTTGWYALPAQVADWWQRRRRSRVVTAGGVAHIEGPAAADGRVWLAQLDGERLQITPASA